MFSILIQSSIIIIIASTILIKKNKNILLAAIALAIYIFSTKASYYLMLPSAIQNNHYKCDGSVVLGGSNDHDRTMKGIQLALTSENITIFSGKGYKKKYSMLFENLALTNIIFENDSVNTYENAIYTKKFVENYNIERLCIITSQEHMTRAITTFNKSGIKTKAVYSTNHTSEIDISSLLPSTKYYLLNTNIAYEYIALAYYKARGRL